MHLLFAAGGLLLAIFLAGPAFAQDTTVSVRGAIGRRTC